MNNQTISTAELENIDFGVDDLGLEDFDAAEFLDSPEARAAFLSAALDTKDFEHIKEALNTVARSESMTEIAALAGITREGMYKSLKPGTKTQVPTFLGILDALGMALKVVPKEVLAHNDNSYALPA